MGQTYSQTTWIVKPGSEDEFVRRWQELAAWSAAHGLAKSTLLRDNERRNRFVSFGPWESLDAVRRWRGMPDFHERIQRVQEVLEGFEPHTLEQVSEQSRRGWRR
jgi:heme-degrading monooxygenase HmoA